MSGHYYADLRSIGECKELCQMAQSKLCEIETAIEYLRESSGDLINDEINEIIKVLQKTKVDALEKIGDLSNRIQVGMPITELQQRTQDAKVALNKANDLIIVKIGAIKTAVRDVLHASIEKSASEIDRMAAGHARTRSDMPAFLNAMEDTEIRNMVRLLSRNPQYNDFTLDEIKGLAEKRMRSDSISKEEKESLKRSAIKRMEENRLDPQTIENIINGPNDNIMEIVNSADNAIVSENVRKESIKAIVSTIADKGFIVEKKNIRMLRETNTVKVTAMKPGGQKAEFSINIDGSFIYKFDEYEGQACQKDIMAFKDDLNSVYGIKIENIREDWSNPDKTMKMNYQRMDVRKGG